LINFKHQLPTTEEVNSFKQYCLAQDNNPWNPSLFSDIKVDLVEQDISKLSYFDLSDAYDTNVKGKYANLVFHLDTVVMKNANDINQLNKDSFYSKSLPAKNNYEKLSPSQTLVSNAKAYRVK
jgi:hypothetical protein